MVPPTSLQPQQPYLLDVHTVLIERRGTDHLNRRDDAVSSESRLLTSLASPSPHHTLGSTTHLQLSPRKCRLEDVGRVDAALGRARANERV